MQRWQTRHDTRGICTYNPLIGGVATNALAGGLDAAGLGLGAALGPLTGGLSLLPSLLGLGGTPINQTTNFTPTVNQTTNQSSPFDYSLNLSQIGGPGGNAASSGGLFGFGSSAKGGAGGSNSAYVNYNPQTSLTSNLPAPLQQPAMANFLTGGAQQNVMTRPNMMPMPTPQSPMGMMMNTTQPIAAGGVSPQLAGMLALGQQQQLVQPGQQIIPGSAVQAGGYDMPPQQQGPMGGMPQMSPQGMSMQQRLQGMANPMAMALTGGQPQLQSEQAQMAPQPQALQGDTGRNVAPNQPVSQDQQDVIDELERLKGQVSPAAAAAIDNFTKSVGSKLAAHKANKEALTPKLQEAEAKNEAIVQQAHDLATPEGNSTVLQATKDAIYNKKTPAEQAAITRGANRFRLKGSAHPKLRTALGVAGILGNTGIARGARAIEARLEATELKEEKRDDDAYKNFLTEVHQSMSEEHAAQATELTGADAEVTNYRQQLSHNDELLRQGIENANDMYMKPGQMNLEALGKEATMTQGQSAARARGVSEAEQPIKLALEGRNTAANERRAATGAEQLGLATERFNAQQQKLGGELTKQQLENQKLKQQLEGNQWTGQFAALKPAAGIKLDQYQDYLYEEVRAHRLTGATAKEANRKASILLKED